jgi:hypothetical protein
MRTTLVVMFLAAGIAFAGHPFSTNGAVLLNDRDANVEISGGSDFVKERNGFVKTGFAYGIANRFQVGINHYWHDLKRGENSERFFTTPDLTMKMAIRPNFIAIKATSSLDASAFDGFLLYTFNLEKIKLALNFDLGFVSDGARNDAFGWKYSAVKSINENFFVGGEVYGSANGDMEKDAKKPLWTVGTGHKVFSRKTHTVSLGLGGSFVSNDDLYVTLAMTYSGRVLAKGETDEE